MGVEETSKILKYVNITNPREFEKELRYVLKSLDPQVNNAIEVGKCQKSERVAFNEVLRYMFDLKNFSNIEVKIGTHSLISRTKP